MSLGLGRRTELWSDAYLPWAPGNPSLTDRLWEASGSPFSTVGSLGGTLGTSFSFHPSFHHQPHNPHWDHGLTRCRDCKDGALFTLEVLVCEAGLGIAGCSCSTL